MSAETLKRLYLAGKTINEIAYISNLTHTEVRALIDVPTLADVRKASFAELYEQGLNDTQIARINYCTPANVLYWRKQTGREPQYKRREQ